jgi:hypothetical protein
MILNQIAIKINYNDDYEYGISAKFAIVVALLHRGYLLLEVVLVEFACFVIFGPF